MKKIALVVALTIASLNVAHAQNAAPGAARFFVGAGLTFGGDKLAEVEYTDGDSSEISAGGLIALNAGLDYQVTPEFSFQASIGYHVDDTSAASNGSIRLERYPLELLAYYHVSPQWKIGGGARYVSSTRLRSSGAAFIGNYSFDNTVSGVLEAEYLFGSNVGVKVRYVSEKYEEKISKEKVDANHVGIYANYYF